MAIYKEYRNFEGLLVSFEIDSHENMNDHETIELFVKGLDKDSILEVIKEGKKLLALPEKDFPADWVADLTRKLPFSRWDEYSGVKSIPPGDYRDWVKWMVEELEKEAKKQGKYEELGNDEAVKKKIEKTDANQIFFAESENHYKQTHDLAFTINLFIKDHPLYSIGIAGGTAAVVALGLGFNAGAHWALVPTAAFVGFTLGVAETIYMQPNISTNVAKIIEARLNKTIPDIEKELSSYHSDFGFMPEILGFNGGDSKIRKSYETKLQKISYYSHDNNIKNSVQLEAQEGLKSLHQKYFSPISKTIILFQDQYNYYFHSDSGMSSDSVTVKGEIKAAEAGES